MPSIEDFLRARLDEDQVLAGDAENQLSGVWKCIERSNGALKVTGELGYSVIEGADIESAPYFTGPHIARHNPARVLAEVAAKRKRLEQYVEQRAIVENIGNNPDKFTWEQAQVACGVLAALEFSVRLDAETHAENPDYDPAWRVA